MATINPAITLENLTSILSNVVFNQHKIRLTQRTGNINIEIKPARTINNGFATFTIPDTHYTLGYTPGIGYWLRRKTGFNSTFRLHYNRKTGEYGFNTFEEAANWLEKLFIEKFFVIKPVTK
jgi:hypothetical protein